MSLQYFKGAESRKAIKYPGYVKGLSSHLTGAPTAQRFLKMSIKTSTDLNTSNVYKFLSS